MRAHREADMFVLAGLRRVFRHTLRSGVVVGSVLAALFFAGTALGVIRHIGIEDLGFVPGVVDGGGSQDLQWTNYTQVPKRVAASDGLFDSGSIPPGGGFSMKLQVPGTHSYSSGSWASGTVVVPLTGLPGPGTDPAADHIPDAAFPPSEEGDIEDNQRWGVPASRTRILLGFKAGATVAEANAALSAANVKVIGGLPNVGALLVQAPESPECGTCDPFYYLTDSLNSLRANARVAFAAMSLAAGTQSVPRGPGDGAATATKAWTWGTRTGGGNWGMKSARFPQAWNFLESIRHKSQSTVTGIVDAGFEAGHPDLSSTLTVATQVCPVGGACRAIGNKPAPHGTHVAGIIGAAYDNDLTPKQDGKSVGVSGGNPVATMRGFSSKDFE